jgi:hypothetical protein
MLPIRLIKPEEIALFAKLQLFLVEKDQFTLFSGSERPGAWNQ